MKHILVVDDSATMRRMVKTLLCGIDAVRVDEAVSGLEALERLSLQRYHLLVLDLNMPDIHGLEVLQFVRGHQAYQQLPVVVLTTRGDDTSRAMALAAGASVYLTKPFDPAGLVEKVRGLLDGDGG